MSCSAAAAPSGLQVGAERTATAGVVVGADGARRSAVRRATRAGPAIRGAPALGPAHAFPAAPSGAPELRRGVGRWRAPRAVPDAAARERGDGVAERAGRRRRCTRGGGAARVHRAPSGPSARLRGAKPVSAARGRAPPAASARAGVAPGLVLLGDAAGFTDPLTGGGIAQALLSAESLARHLPRALAERDDEWLWRFDRRRRALLRDYAASVRGAGPGGAAPLAVPGHPGAACARSPRSCATW